MNWSRVKSILIIFLLITNSALFGVLLESDSNLYSIDPDTLKSAVNILQNARISISEDILPKKNPKMSYIEAYNIIEDNDIFAAAMIGADAEYIDGKYISAAGEVTIQGDMFSVNYTDKNFFDTAEYSDIKKKTRHILDKTGFGDIGGYDIEVNNTGSIYEVIIKNKPDSKYFFDSWIKIVMTDEYVNSINGVWFVCGRNIHRDRIETKSVTGVLIDFMNRYKDNAPMEITGLSAGYYKGEPDEYHKSFVLVPVWRIETSNGGEYYMDTRRTE